jgi:hypothetical protein
MEPRYLASALNKHVYRTVLCLLQSPFPGNVISRPETNAPLVVTAG